MTVIVTLASLAGGLVLLVLGAELLVRGASGLALAAGISPLVVGLTVVAFGTSAPEVVVTVGSSVAGQGDVAIGNVVGSNIFNVLFILGVSALITPLSVHSRLLRVDVPLMIGASLAVLVIALDGQISRGEGLALVAGIVSYTLFSVWAARRDPARTDGPVEPVRDQPNGRWPRHVALVLGGLGLLVAGAWLLVGAAVTLAEALGIGELVIGLTIVAVGTSLPEVATSIVAATRGQRDIAVANVVGSNIFNLLAVLGLGSVAAPAGLAVASGVRFVDLPVMIGVALATLPVVYTGQHLSRWEGAAFLASYVAYTTYLVLDATGHAASRALGEILIWVVLPLAAFLLGVAVVRTMRDRGRGPDALEP